MNLLNIANYNETSNSISHADKHHYSYCSRERDTAIIAGEQLNPFRFPLLALSSLNCNINYSMQLHLTLFYVCCMQRCNRSNKNYRKNELKFYGKNREARRRPWYMISTITFFHIIIHVKWATRKIFTTCTDLN